jgi:hypothetical protein
MTTSKYPQEVPDIKKREWFFKCPECDQKFTDPQEVAYGHDCEG